MQIFGNDVFSMQYESELILGKLDECKGRLKRKCEAIEELQYERDLIVNDIVSTINNKIRNSSINLFAGFKEDFLYNAWRWDGFRQDIENELKNSVITEEQYKTYESCFDYVKTMVLKTFFTDDMRSHAKLEEILNYCHIGYVFTFDYCDEKIQILIPTFFSTPETYESMLSGYRALFRENEVSWRLISSGLDYRKVAEELRNWLIDKRGDEEK